MEKDILVIAQSDVICRVRIVDSALLVTATRADESDFIVRAQALAIERAHDALQRRRDAIVSL
jgi:hypothetical protein